MYKQATLYANPDEPYYEEIKGYLAGQKINLVIHDLKKNPLNNYQISGLIKHFDIRHFLDTTSGIYKKKKLDKTIPGRQEVIEMIAEDNDLLRRPILVAGRLMTVGCNRQKIMEMLQIKTNGSDPKTR